MSAPDPTSGEQSACLECRRRSWLLGALSATLDYRAGEPSRLGELLALEDHELLRALAGRRHEELRARYQTLTSAELPTAAPVEAICRHHDRFPKALRGDPVSPWMLNVSGGCERLERLLEAPVVALSGSRRASDYGIAMARSLARELAASGISVVSGLQDGVAAAALTGALEAGGALAFVGSGLGVARQGRRRSLNTHVTCSGCAVSELPHDCRGRRWGAVAGERVIARLSSVVVVVEAEENPRDMALAGAAAALGRTVAAMPGRLTSPLSAGSHALLLDGARLVRGAEDVLELLYPLSDSGPRPARPRVPSPAEVELEPRLARILERVGAGYDTPDRLAEPGTDAGELLLGLSELELRGMIGRGRGGRYFACRPTRAGGVQV